MKKTISITLNGLIFNIEEGAYAKLDSYLESIRNHYGKNESREILDDIESSIAEKFSEKTKDVKRVVTEKDVEDIIKIMGTVRDFEAQGDQGAGEEKKTREEKIFSSGKRLYRNPDDTVIAGVSSGVASYFGIDPVLIRLLFVILVFFNGLGVLAYVIGWIAMPEAKTNSQKLEMQGEPVNIKKLEETIKEKAQMMKEEGQTAFSKIKTNKGVFYRIVNFPIQVFRAMMLVLTKILHLVWPITRVFFGSLAIIASVASVMGLTIASGVVIFNIGSAYIVSDLPLDVLTGSVLYYVGVVSVYFLAVIPLFFLFLLGLSLVRGKNSFRVLVSGFLVGVWILAAAAGVVAAGDLVPKVMSQLDEQAASENITRFYHYDNFNKLYLGANMDVKVKLGNEFKISMIGREKDLNRLSFNLEEGQLQIVQKSAREAHKLCVFCFNKEIKAEITVPDLKSFVSFQSAEAELDRFSGLEKISVGESSEVKANLRGGNIEIYVAGTNGKLEILGSPNSINATLEGFGRLVANELNAQKITITQEASSRVYLKGTASELTARVSALSNLLAKDLRVKIARIKVSDLGKAEVYASETLEAIAQDRGKIYYKGNPELTAKEILNGQIGELNDYDFEATDDAE